MKDDLELCRQGNRDALNRVLRAHSRAIQATISRLYGWGPDGQDVMQRTLMAAVRAFPNFRGDASVKSWLIGIAINQVREARRRRARAPDSVSADDEFLAGFDSGDRPDHELERRALVRRAQGVLDGLSEKLRDAYVLHVILGYTVPETAEILDIPTLTAKTRLARARRIVDAAAARDDELTPRIHKRGASV